MLNLCEWNVLIDDIALHAGRVGSQNAHAHTRTLHTMNYTYKHTHTHTHTHKLDPLRFDLFSRVDISGVKWHWPGTRWIKGKNTVYHSIFDFYLNVVLFHSSL